MSVRKLVLLSGVLLLLSLQVGCNKCPIPDYVITEPSMNGSMGEDLVVCGLLKESKPFAKFYEAERKNMPPHINWIENKSLLVAEAETDPWSNTTELKQIPPRSLCG
jgi:hypothetical protein